MNEKNKENNTLAALLDEPENIVGEYDNRHAEEKSAEKYSRKKNGIVILFSIMFSTLLGAGITLSFISNEKKIEPDIPEVNNFDEFKRGRISGSLRSAMNSVGNNENEIDTSVIKPQQKKAKINFNQDGKNKQKDAEIQIGRASCRERE